MDLREYEYITFRPDTFPLSLLRSIREVLSKTQSFSSVELIDKVIITGYIQPPSDYKWHGYYQVLLTDDEKKLVLEDLVRAQETLDLSSDEQHYLNGYVEGVSRCLTEKPISYNDHIAQHPYYDLRDISLDGFQDGMRTSKCGLMVTMSMLPTYTSRCLVVVKSYLIYTRKSNYNKACGLLWVVG